MMNGISLLNISLDSLLWNILLIVFFISAVVGAVVFYLYSKKPDEWNHQPRINGGYQSGRLKSLAQSIQVSTMEDVGNTPLKQFIQTVFFEKFRSIRGISPAELIDLQNADSRHLRQLIGDEEIANWLSNIKPDRGESGVGLLKRTTVNKKEKYLMEINSILDKMEAWGE